MEKKNYKLYDRKKLVGEYSLQELSERFGYSQITIKDYIYKRRQIEERYTIEPINKGYDKKIPESLLEEWENVRIRLNPRAKRREQYV